MTYKLQRYIATQVLQTIFLVLAFIVSLDSVFSFVDEINALKARYSIENALYYIVLQIPEQTYNYLPFAVFIGCIVALGRLSSNSEIIVIRATGRSLLQIASMTIKPVFVCLILGLIVGEFIVPHTSQVAENYRATMRMLPGQFSEEGFWYRKNREYVYIKAIESTRVLHGITSYQFDEKNHLLQALFAEKAIRNRSGWQLQKVNESLFTKNKVIVKKLKSKKWNLKLSAKKINLITTTPQNQSIRGLHQYATYMRTLGLNPKEYELAFWSKLLQPINVIILSLLGISAVFGPLRSKTMGLRVFTGVITSFIISIMQKTLGPVSVVFGFSPLVATITPMLICAIASVILLNQHA